MKAIPTTYAGARFRSRLEARWAALFDIIGLPWDYEPADMEGWAPDFLLVTPRAPIFVEVKPTALHVMESLSRPRSGSLHLKTGPEFDKARAHWRRVWVLALGAQPNDDADYFTLGTLFDPPDGATATWWEMAEFIRPKGNTRRLWREAGARVRWNAQ